LTGQRRSARPRREQQGECGGGDEVRETFSAAKPGAVGNGGGRSVVEEVRKSVRENVSVVGQGKDSGSQWPGRPGFHWFPHDFRTGHSGAAEVIVTRDR
jgi:hypothetical protein